MHEAGQQKQCRASNSWRRPALATYPQADGLIRLPPRSLAAFTHRDEWRWDGGSEVVSAVDPPGTTLLRPTVDLVQRSRVAARLAALDFRSETVTLFSLVRATAAVALLLVISMGVLAGCGGGRQPLSAATTTTFPAATTTLPVSTTTRQSTTATSRPASIVTHKMVRAAAYTDQAPGGAATAGKKVIALTFDDGPGPYTPQIASVLKHYHVAATFFEIGTHIVQYPQYTRWLVAAGYPVENHTWTHPDLDSLPISQLAYQIDQTQNEIRSLTGWTPRCVRPPYNDFDATVLAQIAERGLTTMSYSIAPTDYSRPGTEAIVQQVVAAAFPGAVVDLHDGGGNRDETVAALPQIVTDLKAAGYTFVSIC
jgi:peptidoglycan-N-acetylglucosamine deacetylase